jgi:hypothetical protein
VMITRLMLLPAIAWLLPPETFESSCPSLWARQTASRL